ETRLVVSDISVGQSLGAVQGNRVPGDFSTRGIEVVEVQAEKERVARSRPKIKAGEESQIIVLSGLFAEVGIQCVQGVRNLLQVDGIVRVGSPTVARHWQGGIRRRKWRSRRNTKAGFIGLRNGLIYYRNRSDLVLLLVIKEEPQAIRAHGATKCGPK